MHFWCSAFFILLLFPFTCTAQHLERKIIIDNGSCYYTSIDPEFQIATLHVVELKQPFASAKKLVLPAGRNFNVPVIPLSWDITGRDLLVVNFMNNARSNRKQAIKKIPIHSLNEWNKNTSISDVMIASAEYPAYTGFEPYSYILERSATLDHFFFDGIDVSDSSFCFAVSNNGSLSTWRYENNGWSRGEEIEMQVDDFFSLFTYKTRPYMLTNDGRIYAIKNNKLMQKPEKIINVHLSDVVLIIDKMNDTVSFINASVFDEKKSMEELMKKATLVF